MKAREIILIQDVHPNENAASAMVVPLAERLSQIGLNVTIITPLITREFSRSKMAETIGGSHPDALTIEIHDSDIDELRKGGLGSDPFIGPYPTTPTVILEFPAVYIANGNSQAESRGDGLSPKDAKYFSHRSDFSLSQQAGLCNDRALDIASQLILERLR